MIHASFAVTVGWLGVSLGAVSTYVQYQRSRQVSTEGISLATWYQFALMSVFWISYGLAVHQIVIVAGSLICLPMQVSIVARLSPLQNMTTIVRSSAFILVCSLAPTLLLGWSAGVLGTGIVMVANRFPQIATLVRHPGDLGVSALSWLMGAVCSLMWVAFYLGARLWAPLVVTALAMAGNLAIAALAQWRHREARAFDYEPATA